MIDIPFNEGKFLITSLDQNVKNRNRHLSRIKMIWSGQERQKQVVDFEEGEGVTSRSNSLFYFCFTWFWDFVTDGTSPILWRLNAKPERGRGIGEEMYFFVIKTFFENPPQNFCFSRMVTEGFDDERENVDELWGFDVFWLKIVETLLTLDILCMNNVKTQQEWY